MAIEVRKYVGPTGRCPFDDWVEKLDHSAAAKVLTAILRMEQGNLGDHKSVGGGVLERRVHTGPGYRLYFGRDGQRLVLLLGGGTKSSQARDIREARACWDAYQQEKKV